MSRTLREDDLWTENAWDNVELDLKESQILDILNNQKAQRVDPTLFHSQPEEFWNSFYKKNGQAFFKDRKWLTLEFKELFSQIPLQIMEFGCGVGNSIKPLLNSTNHYITGVDYSHEAIQLIKNDLEFSNPRLNVFTWDITTDIPTTLQKGSMDIILCVFVLSALHPDSWSKVVDNIYSLLKPGGLVLFRDYGRYDLTQLRFKSQRWLDDNFYVRGDGTRVYFFTNQELEQMFHKFEILQNNADNRLLVNR